MQRRQIVKALGLYGLMGAGAPAVFGASSIVGASNMEPYAWKSVPFGGGGFIDGLLFHPHEAGLLYARTDKGGAYRWDAATKSWTALLDHLSADDGELMSVLSVAVDPNDSQRVYLACGSATGEWSRKAALLASADRGGTWRLHELDLRLGGAEGGRGSGERLQVDPQKGEVLLLGTTHDGLKKSVDRGQSFQSTGFSGKHVSLVLFDASSAASGSACKTFYVGCQDQPGLYASRDGGQSFTREPGTPAQVPQRAAFGPDGTLYVSFIAGRDDYAPNPGNVREGSVWKRSPNGQWRDITPSAPAGRHYGYSALDVDQQGRIITSMLFDHWDGPGDELFLSTDGGFHWVALGERSRHDAKPYPWLAEHRQNAQAMGRTIADAKFDPHETQRLVYGTEYGVWATNNVGAWLVPGGTVQWDFAVAHMEAATVSSLLSPSGGALLFGAMGDGLAGAAWDDSNKTPSTGLFRPAWANCRSVDAAWLAPAVVARTVEAEPGGYVSLDGGADWRPFGLPANSKEAKGGHVAVSAKGGFLLWVPPRQAALHSRDHGRTWSVCMGWPDTRDAELVPVADKAVEGVFYVHDFVTGGILVSTNGGENFTLSVTGLPKLNPGWQSAQLVVAPGSVRDLWVAGPEGLIHVFGLEGKSSTVRAVSEARFVALGKAAPGAKYHSVYVWGRVSAGGAQARFGLFRSDDVGDTFQPIDDEKHRYGSLVALAADPLEFGTVYLAPRGRGVVMGSLKA